MRLSALAIALICFGSVSCTHSEAPVQQHPIIGSWKFVIPGSNCFEIYTFHSDGKRLYSSGEENGESVFEISDNPSSAGYYSITDTVTRNNGKPDCSGDVTPIGDKVTVFVRFQRGDEFTVCAEESIETCVGPFKRVKDVAP